MGNFKMSLGLRALRLLRAPSFLALLTLLLVLAAGCKGHSESTSVTLPPIPGYPPGPLNPPAQPSGPSSPVPAGTNGIGAVVISQGVQDTTGTLPLVAGRNATVRVFLAAPAGSAQAQAQPTVTVALWDATGRQLLNQTIAAPGQTIPASPQMANITDTWNADVPGTLIQPGVTFQAAVVADAQSQGLTQTTWPAGGQPQPLNVVLNGNTFRLTLVPVTTRPYLGGPASTGQVVSATRTLADWTASLRKWFPVGSSATAIDVQVAPAWDPGLTYGAATESFDLLFLRNALERMRKASTGSAFRFYAGIFTRASGATVLGMGDTGRPGQDAAKSLLCLDSLPGGDPDDDGPGTIVHELGHNLGRYHAPCRAGGADLNYPYPGGTLGTWGLDPATHLVKDPMLYRDLMGYCTPYWISDYTYKAVQDAMAADQAGSIAYAAAQATDAILVTGRINAEGSAVLDPFLDVQDLPSDPEPGPYLLNLFDSSGNTIANVPFGLDPATEGDEADTFCFEVDLTPAQEARLDHATVTAPNGSLTQQVSLAKARTAREPLALAWKGGVHLGWDQGVHPEVLVRDPRSGAVIATAHGGGVDLATDARELDLIMLDGIHTTIRRVRVTP